MKDPEIHAHIYVLTGPVQGGKTTLVADLVKKLKEEIRISGFLCPGTFSEGIRSEFKLVNIETGRQIPMGSVQEIGDWVKYRRFYFNPEAFIQGSKWIRDGLAAGSDLLVIDEVGPMELEGMGWSEILDILQNKGGINQLWIVRHKILRDVAVRWKIPNENIVTIELSKDDQAINRLAQKIRSKI